MKKISLISLMMLVTIFVQAQIKNPLIEPTRPGTISITSNPSGCSLSIDGEFIGKSPKKIKRNPGTYTIVFELIGYESQTKSVKVTSDKTTKINVELVPPPVPTPKDSIILSANEIIGMGTNYENATLTTEEKDIVSFQKNAVDYAKGVKEIYEKIVTMESVVKMSNEELKVIITNCVLRNQHCNNLEKPCVQSALSMFQNMENAKSNVYQGVNMVELAKLASIVQKQAINKETTAKIVELIGQVKLTEALDLYQQGLLNPEIIERYNSFLSVLKGFYVLSNMRMTEIKNEKDAQVNQ